MAQAALVESLRALRRAGRSARGTRPADSSRAASSKSSTVLAIPGLPVHSRSRQPGVADSFCFDVVSTQAGKPESLSDFSANRHLATARRSRNNDENGLVPCRALLPLARAHADILGPNPSGVRIDRRCQSTPAHRLASKRRRAWPDTSAQRRVRQPASVTEAAPDTPRAPRRGPSAASNALPEECA